MGHDFLTRPTRRRDDGDRVWNDERVIELARRHAGGQTPRLIAEAMGIDRQKVEAKLEQGWGARLRALVANATGVVRKCMRCPQRFLSQGAHHRLCDRCRAYAGAVSPFSLDTFGNAAHGRVLPKKRSE